MNVRRVLLAPPARLDVVKIFLLNKIKVETGSEQDKNSQ